MDTNFSHEQSLSLINEMIRRAQNNVERNYSLIYWGYLAAAVAIVNYVLIHTLNNPNQSFLIWWIMLPAAIPGYFIERRSKRKKMVKTHFGKISGMVWVGFLISWVIFMIVLNTVCYKHEIYRISVFITPICMIMFGMGQFITACVLRYKLLYATAALSWIGAIACAFLNTDLHMIVFAVNMILGCAVPGHILNYQAKKSHV